MKKIIIAIIIIVVAVAVWFFFIRKSETPVVPSNPSGQVLGDIQQNPYVGAYTNPFE